jgi:YYY domain-containing protein
MTESSYDWQTVGHQPASAQETSRLRAALSRVRAWLNTATATWIILSFILAIGAYLRLSHVNWDMGTHLHPDERFLTMVESSMRLPKDVGEFFDSTRSPLNPYNYEQFPLFVYGTLPIFIVRYVAEFANRFNQSAQIWTAAPGIPLNLIGYDGVHFVGRTVSGLFDLACVWLIFVVARRLYDRRVGLVAAALYAFAVLPLQQSHFFTVDTFGSFFALLTFYFAVRVAQGGQAGRRGGGWPTYAALGASLGATIACRINLAPLAGIALLAAVIRAWDDWHEAPVDGVRDTRWLATLVQATLFRLLLMGLVTIAVFRVAQPYAFGGTKITDFSFSQHWLQNMQWAKDSSAGNIDMPPGHQWASRTAFVFPFTNMVIWGMGVPMGLAGWAGWALATWQVLRGLTRRRPVPGDAAWREHILPVAWIGGMFLWNGLQYVESMRYLLPLYPILAMMAAWLLWWLVDRARRLARVEELRRATAAEPVLAAGGADLLNAEARDGADSPVLAEAGSLAPEPVSPLLAAEEPSVRRMADPADAPVEVVAALATRRAPGLAEAPQTRTPRRLLPILAYACLAAVVIGTVLWGWGFLAIYRRPFSRVTASRWIYENIPAGSRLANEHWDDGMPVSIDGKLSFRPAGEYNGLSTSSDGQLQMYNEDTPEKREQLYQWLNEADYIIMSSNRLYGSIPRLPMRYPMTTLYYKLLFEGKLGYQQVAQFTSYPTIFGIQFPDQGAEEAFSVYDHPVVTIFKKTAQYDPAKIRSYFDAVDLEETIMMWPKQVSAAPTALLLPASDAAHQQAGGTWTGIFNPDNLVNKVPVLVWLVLLEILGLAAFPLTFSALRGLSDRGYGVSKVLGILLLAWLSWIGPALKILPYQRWEIALALLLLICVGGYLAWSRRAELARFVRARGSLLLTEEAIFLLLFALFLLVRWGNPDLWHPARGGEKPMDFAYLNAVIKSTTFPPYDPWFANGFIDYYYFGFVIVGTLIKLTGIVPWVAYNLAVPALFALTGTGAFAVVYSLAAGDPTTVFPDEVAERGGLWLGPLLAGIAGTLFVAFIGNLGEAKLIWDGWVAHSTLTLQSSLPGIAGLLRGLDGAAGWLFRRQPLSFPNDWWFWNASRVIPDTINEFPFFTFTYADLHAHMIALPLTLLGLATAVALVRMADFGSRVVDFAPDQDTGAGPENGRAVPATPDERSPWYIGLTELVLLVLFGFVVGALRATNTWDFPTYLIIGLAAVSVAEAHRRLQLPFPAALDERLAFLFRGLVAVIWRMVIIFGVASLTFYPFTRSYATAYAGLQLWDEAKTNVPDYLVVHGFFLLMVTIYLLSEWWVQVRDEQTPRWLQNLFPLIIAAVVFVIAVGLLLFHVSVWVIALPLFTLAMILALGRDIPPARRFALLMIALALGITMGVEIVRQKDDIGRMNTVFKFYMQAWVLFATAAAFGLGSWAARSVRWSPDTRRLAWALAAVVFALCALYPPLAARAKVLDRFSAEDQPHGLDGMAYMNNAQYVDNNRDMLISDDKAAIEWMLRNVPGSPVILEGNTPGYRWGNRFAIYTGLPAVMGWDWHERQQRSVVPGAVIDRRLNQVKEVYSTTDVARAEHLLDYHNVAYIIVGELERAYYSPEGLAKFDQMVAQGYLKQVYEQGSVRIYQVVGRDTPADQGPNGRIDLLSAGQAPAPQAQ